MQTISKHQVLLYSSSEQARNQLLAHPDWLQDIKGELFKRQFRVVVHNIQATEDLRELAIKIRDQNNLQHIPHAQWLGGTPNKSGTIILGLDTPEEANRLLDSGLLLDYEIKGTYIHRTRTRCLVCKTTSHTRAQCTKTTTSRMPSKCFYKEPRPKDKEEQKSAMQETPTTETNQMEGIKTTQQDTDDLEECIIIAGTQKRRILTPAGRRGPKEDDQNDLDTFLLAQPLETQLRGQTIPASNE